MKNFSTLSELIAFQSANFNNPQALNFKEKDQTRSFSNQEFRDNIFHFACGLREIGLEDKQSFAIISYQNPIWLTVDFGAILAGAITVPIFHNISKINLFYELEDADVKYVFCDSEEFCEIAKSKNLNVKIITYGFRYDGCITYEDILLRGKKAADDKKYSFESLLQKAKPQDVVTIIYTSGSTGKPKGVELTHQNLVSQIVSTSQIFPLSPDSVALSFLPLAHIFERMVMMFYISQGITIHFANNLKNVGGDLRNVCPSLITSVPRMLEKVFAHIKSGVDSSCGFKKFLGKKALKRALKKNPDSARGLRDLVYDALVYKKFREALGGKINMIICGGAALSKDLEIFYQNIGVNLFCGYGMTEASPVVAANYPGAKKIGTVGKAFPGVELKLTDVGELLVKGPNVMRAYHNQPEQTAEVIEDGWLKSGDLAEIDKDGFVKVVGRKKEFFKNANGKYISPVPIEQQLIHKLGFLLGAIVIAEAKKFTAAILFPDFDVLGRTKEKLGFVGDDQDFIKSEVLQSFVQQAVNEINESLDHWEWIQKFHIASDHISIDSGEITPSMKLKRSVLEEKYKDVINEFYAE